MLPITLKTVEESSFLSCFFFQSRADEVVVSQKVSGRGLSTTDVSSNGDTMSN